MRKFFVILFSVCLLFCGCSVQTELEKISQTLSKYVIDVSVDEATHTLSGHEKFAYKNDTGVKLETLCFHLYPNAFSQTATSTKAVSAGQFERAYPNGFSEGGIIVSNVCFNNQTCTYEIGGPDQNILIVSLPQNLGEQSSCIVDFDFVSALPNANHRFGYGEHTINCGNFYPILCVFEEGEWVMRGYSPNGDPFYSNLANYEVNISYPSAYTLASTGIQTISKDIIQAKSKCVASCVRDFAFVLSKEFEVKSQKVGEVIVNYYFYDDQNAETNLETCVQALSTFNSMVGQYPYGVLNVCKANFLQGGMEYPNLVLISDAVDVDSEYKNVIVHEIGHQWFYGIVGNDEVSHPWLDEALTEYITALFYDKNPAYNKTSASVIGSALSSYLLYCDMYREVYGEMDTSMNRSIYDYKNEAEYTYLTYVKGVLMFDSVADIVGHNKIEKCIKQYYKDNAFSNATPKNLIQSFERASGKKLSKYISSWLDGSVVLEELSE